MTNPIAPEVYSAHRRSCIRRQGVRGLHRAIWRLQTAEHNLLAVPIAETRFEPRVGGHIYDRGIDGSECQWARVLVYEPPTRVVFSWDIGPTWQLVADANTASEVEVTFVAESPERAVSNSSIAISTDTDQAGKPSPTVSRAMPAGRCTSTDTPPCSPKAAEWRRSAHPSK